MKKDSLRLNIKLLIVILLLVLTIFFSIKYYLIITTKEDIKAALYEEKGLLDYEVCLVQNQYIDEECFKGNRSFVTSLIDYINIKLDYSYHLSDANNYKYQYKVNANVIANEKGDNSKVIYYKEEVLDQKVVNSIMGKDITILDNIKIDYQKYNSLITEFKKQYFLSLDSKLEIIVSINVTDFNNQFDDNNSKKMDLIIPLAEQTTNIISDNNNLKNNGFINSDNDNDISFLDYIVLGILLIMMGIFLIVLIRIIKNIINNQKNYYGLIKKIKKQYDGVIAIIKKTPTISNYKLIEVTCFEELLDVRNTLSKPILLYEDSKKLLASFYVLNNNEIYLFELKGNIGKKDDYAKKIL